MTTDRQNRSNQILTQLGITVTAVSADGTITVSAIRNAKSAETTFEIDRLDHGLGILIAGERWIGEVRVPGAAESGDTSISDVRTALALAGHALNHA